MLRTVVLRWVHLAGEAEKKGGYFRRQRESIVLGRTTAKNIRVRIGETKPNLQSSETPDTAYSTRTGYVVGTRFYRSGPGGLATFGRTQWKGKGKGRPFEIPSAPAHLGFTSITLSIKINQDQSGIISDHGDEFVPDAPVKPRAPLWRQVQGSSASIFQWHKVYIDCTC